MKTYSVVVTLKNDPEHKVHSNIPFESYGAALRYIAHGRESKKFNYTLEEHDEDMGHRDIY